MPSSIPDADKTGVTLKPRPNGPLVMSGDYEISLDGIVLAKGPNPVALCRCGHSAKNPFCDGSHNCAESEQNQD